MERPEIDAAVRASLAQHLGLPEAEVEPDRSLEELGLDSHGLMRVLMVIEQRLGLERELELDDEALATPASLAAGVAAAVG